MHSLQHLSLFAKYWSPGRVKTRLAASVGAERAAEFYRVSLECLLRRFGEDADQRCLVIDPPEQRSAFEQVAGDRWTCLAQVEGDLGQRLSQHLEQCLQRDATARYVVIGADSPNLPSAYLEEAFAALKESPVVLGPSADGGYYLVGLRDQVPPIFDAIDWSTDRVWEQTLSCLKSCQLPFHKLPVWYDIDHVEDLQPLARDLRRESDATFAELKRLVEELVGS